MDLGAGSLKEYTRLTIFQLDYKEKETQTLSEMTGKKTEQISKTYKKIQKQNIIRDDREENTTDI